MPKVDLETSIADFLSLGRRLQSQSLTGEAVLNELTAWYVNSRVSNAPPENDADRRLSLHPYWSTHVQLALWKKTKHILIRFSVAF